MKRVLRTAVTISLILGRFKTLISDSLGKDHRVTHTGKVGALTTDFFYIQLVDCLGSFQAMPFMLPTIRLQLQPRCF